MKMLPESFLVSQWLPEFNSSHAWTTHTHPFLQHNIPSMVLAIQRLWRRGSNASTEESAVTHSTFVKRSRCHTKSNLLGLKFGLKC